LHEIYNMKEKIDQVKQEYLGPVKEEIDHILKLAETLKLHKEELTRDELDRELLFIEELIERDMHAMAIQAMREWMVNRVIWASENNDCKKDWLCYNNCRRKIEQWLSGHGSQNINKVQKLFKNEKMRLRNYVSHSGFDKRNVDIREFKAIVKENFKRLRELDKNGDLDWKATGKYLNIKCISSDSQ